MFDVGFSELVLISIIGLLVLGPQRLPKVAAQIGKWVGRARRTATQLRRQLEREIELSELETRPTPPPPPRPANTASNGASPTPQPPGSSDMPTSPATPSQPSAPDGSHAIGREVPDGPGEHRSTEVGAGSGEQPVAKDNS
jgi:sec-independent protein translocase protein TatB